MEQTLTKQNFFGKDPIQWWLGIVVDPKKGKWEKTIKYQKVSDGKEVYYYRARVRILGYHDNEQDLPDDQLPFAQILGPANQSLGVGGEGDLLGLQGGETVLGFFMDGEDGQQPVVFGTLYRNRFVQDTPKANKKTAFEPFTPPKPVKGKHVIDDGMKKGQLWQGGISDNESRDELTLSKLEFNLSTDVRITPPDPCEKNGIGRVSTVLNELINKITRWKEFAGTYYDPILGKIIDVENEITFMASEIYGQFTEWTRKIRENVTVGIYNEMKRNMLLSPKPQQTIIGKAAKIATDAVFCTFEGVISDIFGYVTGSLNNFLGRVAEYTTDIVDSFLGDFFGQLNDILETGFSTVKQIVGLGIDITESIVSALGDSLGFISNLFGGCDKVKCRKPQAWTARYGTIDLPKDNFSKFFKVVNKKTYKKRRKDKVGRFVGTARTDILQDVVGVNTYVVGPPDVIFNGQNVVPAAGLPMVNPSGKIVGVAITNTGNYGSRIPGIGDLGGLGEVTLPNDLGLEEDYIVSGDRDAPIITFSEKTFNGFGGGAIPIMGRVDLVPGKTDVYERNNRGRFIGVVDVAMINPGAAYSDRVTMYDIDKTPVTPTPNPGITTAIPTFPTIQPVNLTPIEEPTLPPIPPPTVMDGYEPEVVDVIVVEPGFGYPDDVQVCVASPSITTSNGDQLVYACFETVVSPEGNILSVNVTRPVTGIEPTERPEIIINSEVGIGAVLIPVVRYTRVDLTQEPPVVNNSGEVISVVDCVGK